MKIGIIGCGNISETYLEVAKSFDILDIAACADLDMARARARAAEYGVPRACTVDELLADPEIEIAINLTIPKAHAEVGMAVLAAGKHLYNEKPLALDRAQADALLHLAASRNLRVGCAPDTFLGGGLQTCRKIIDDGAIGEPVAATAFMLCHGHESWHPDPAFYYQRGGGPMLDMGPYYVTALVTLLGPVRRVTGSARATFPERVVSSTPRHGERIPVEVPTHVAGVLDFAGGAIGTLVTSFDVWPGETPCIEIYGTTGTLSVPDPNGFDGPVRIRRAGASEWSEVPLTHGYTAESRSLGVADMAHAIEAGRAHRASGELARHVLDVMLSFEDASREGRHVELATSCARPAPLPPGLPAGRLDP